MLQHGGLKANSWDHRENTRTLYMNRIFGWLLYMNMNYHIEHHIYPTVPFYNLPKLHKLIKSQLPPPNESFISGLIEMIPAIIKQSKDKNYYIPKLDII
jgi:fatty acid desaturase